MAVYAISGGIINYCHINFNEISVKWAMLLNGGSCFDALEPPPHTPNASVMADDINAIYAPLASSFSSSNYANNYAVKSSSTVFYKPPDHYVTINTALGTNPASLSVMPKSAPPENVFLGYVIVKLVTGIPFSASIACATSNKVVSAG
jgi:hypothetical protein